MESEPSASNRQENYVQTRVNEYRVYCLEKDITEIETHLESLSEDSLPLISGNLNSISYNLELLTKDEISEDSYYRIHKIETILRTFANNLLNSNSYLEGNHNAKQVLQTRSILRETSLDSVHKAVNCTYMVSSLNKIRQRLDRIEFNQYIYLFLEEDRKQLRDYFANFYNLDAFAKNAVFESTIALLSNVQLSDDEVSYIKLFWTKYYRDKFTSLTPDQGEDLCDALLRQWHLKNSPQPDSKDKPILEFPIQKSKDSTLEFFEELSFYINVLGINVEDLHLDLLTFKIVGNLHDMVLDNEEAINKSVSSTNSLNDKALVPYPDLFEMLEANKAARNNQEPLPYLNLALLLADVDSRKAILARHNKFLKKKSLES